MVSTGPALAELQSSLGERGLDDLLARLAKQQPLLVPDTEQAVITVASGDCWVGLSVWNVVRRVRVGSPVRYVFLDPTPCVPAFAMLASGAASPNLARLFLAWLNSPSGQRAYAAAGRVPALADLDVATALSQVVPPGITPQFGSGNWLSQPEAWIERYKQVFGAAKSSRAR